jgi:hypothetical protein
MIVGSGLGHYLLDLVEKNPAGLDYFSGRFTFKEIPLRGLCPGENHETIEIKE